MSQRPGRRLLFWGHPALTDAFREQERIGGDGDLSWEKEESLTRSSWKFLLVSERVDFCVR